VVRPDRVARIGEAPAGRAMAEAAQAQDAETARATAEAPAHGSPALRDRAGRAAAVGPPMGAEQLRGRDRARGRTARGGTRQSALERVPTERDATRAPLRRPGRTDQGPRTIGPARAVRRGESRASGATGRTATHLALARTVPRETRVLSVETVRLGARRTRIVAKVHLPRGRPVRATAVSRRGLTAGRVRLTPDRSVRVIGVVPRVRIVGRVRLIPGRLVKATASGLKDWFVGHARRILGRRVRDSADVPRVPIVDRVRMIPGRRARDTAAVPRDQIVGPEAVPVGRCVATIGRRALSGSYGHPSSRDRRCLGRTAASASRCHRASVRVTTSRRLQRSIRRTYREACALS